MLSFNKNKFWSEYSLESAPEFIRAKSNLIAKILRKEFGNLDYFVEPIQVLLMSVAAFEGHLEYELDEYASNGYHSRWTNHGYNVWNFLMKLKRNVVGEPEDWMKIPVGGEGSLNGSPCDYISLWKLPLSWLECQKLYLDVHPIKLSVYEMCAEPLRKLSSVHRIDNSFWYNFAEYAE